MDGIHPLTLRFHRPELERAWQAQNQVESLRQLRLTLGLAIALFVAFIAVDRTLLPDVAGRLFFVRLVVVLFSFALLAVTWSPSWRRFHAWIVVGAVVTSGGGILVLMLFDRGRGVPHWAGVLMALLALHGLLRPRFPLATLLSAALIVGYHAVAVGIAEIPTEQVLIEDFFLFSAALVGCMTTYNLERTSRERFLVYRHLEEERERSESLLLNILPAPIADRLKAGEQRIADQHGSVTVLFADIVGFTGMSVRLPADELVLLLENVFHELDQIAEEHKIQKIKTVGDAIMFVAGLSGAYDDHAERIAEAALAMQDRVRTIQTPEGDPIRLHIGIATGPVVSGVIGRTRFSYDLWGDVVNTASRMASLGEPGRIQVTEEVVRQLAGRYAFRPRGAIEVKGKGTMETWFLEPIGEGTGNGHGPAALLPRKVTAADIPAR